MHGGKFSEKNIAGDTTMETGILDENDPGDLCAAYAGTPRSHDWCL